jgi:hypothetical protein
MKEQRVADSRALRSGVYEHHRDVQQRRIELTGAAVEAPRLGQRHAHDTWSQRDERQGIRRCELGADSGCPLRPVRRAAGDVRLAPHADRGIQLIDAHPPDGHSTLGVRAWWSM